MTTQDSSHIKILLVEDNPDDALLLRRALKEGERARFSVAHAQSLEEAFGCLAETQFDAALLDLSLPDSARLDTLDALHTRHTALPIVVLTGLDDESLAIEALHRGAQEYLVKGKISNDTLVRCIRYSVERSKAERQLLESEGKYRMLVEQATDAIIVFDQKANFIDANPKTCEMLGYTREELLRLNAEDIIAPEDLARLPVRHREVQSGQVVQAERVLVRKDGSRFLVETNTKMLEDGRIQAIAHDLTWRKEAEAALRQSEERYRTLLASLPQRIFFKDRDSVFLSVNESYAQDVGMTPEQLVGKTDYHLHPKELAAKYRADDRRVMDSRQPETLEEWNILGERKRYVEVVKAPVISDSGEVMGVLGMFTDITARKLAEDEVKRLNKELERRVEERTAQLMAINSALEEEIAERKAVEKELEAFSYSVSHDLHAPLRAITGFSDALGEEYSEKLDDQGQHYLERIRANAKRGGALIDDLLAFSRLGRQPIEETLINMNELASFVVAEINLNASGLLPVPEISVGKLPPAYGDHALIHDVFANLLSNAVKFTRGKQGAHIEVGGRTESDEDVYWVKDNGAGFDMRFASKLFGVFQRLHPPEEFEGTGVGLAIVQRIIHRHGGRVWAEGKVGEGATFYFTLMRET